MGDRESLRRQVADIRARQAMEDWWVYVGYSVIVPGVSFLSGVLLGGFSLKRFWRTLLGFPFIEARLGALVFILAFFLGTFIMLAPYALAQMAFQEKNGCIADPHGGLHPAGVRQDGWGLRSRSSRGGPILPSKSLPRRCRLTSPDAELQLGAGLADRTVQGFQHRSLRLC